MEELRARRVLGGSTHAHDGGISVGGSTLDGEASIDSYNEMVSNATMVKW